MECSGVEFVVLVVVLQMECEEFVLLEGLFAYEVDLQQLLELEELFACEMVRSAGPILQKFSFMFSSILDFSSYLL